jgi:hypothetical protein
MADSSAPKPEPAAEPKVESKDTGLVPKPTEGEATKEAPAAVCFSLSSLLCAVEHVAREREILTITRL